MRLHVSSVVAVTLASLTGALTGCKTNASGSAVKDEFGTPAAASPASSGFTTRDGAPVPVAHLNPALPPTPACDASQVPPFGGECKSPQETDANVLIITKAAFGFQAFQNPKGNTPPLSKRDFHPKSTACVLAHFDVLGGLDPALAQGVFSAGGGNGYSYKAVIRYSNGQPAIKADHTLGLNKDADPDARAMAIKLVGVTGTPLLDNTTEDAVTQDFLLTDFPVFFLRNINSALSFFPGLLDPSHPPVLDDHERASLIGGKRKISDPLDERYWSQGAYALGEGRAVKYLARPAVCPSGNAGPLGRSADDPDPDFLRKNARDRLAQGSVCFDFFVQQQKDTTSTPVEDPTIEWLESDAPPIKVATITIPGPQDTVSDAQQQICENLSFSPWNGIAEHRPLGSINRLRLAVYSGISAKRRFENGVPISDPTGSEDYFRILGGP